MLKFALAALITATPLAVLAVPSQVPVNVETACASDAKATNCEKEKGAGALVKCLQTYRKANKTYQFSASCKDAVSKPIGNF